MGHSNRPDPQEKGTEVSGYNWHRGQKLYIRNSCGSGMSFKWNTIPCGQSRVGRRLVIKGHSIYITILIFLTLATLTHIFSITKPTVIFCDGQDYEKLLAATEGWKPELITVTDSVEGVPHIDSLLEPTTTEMFYQ